MITFGKGPLVDGILNTGGSWCWNSEYGCHSSFYAMRIAVILAVVLVGILLVWSTEKRRK